MKLGCVNAYKSWTVPDFRGPCRYRRHAPKQDRDRVASRVAVAAPESAQVMATARRRRSALRPCSSPYELGPARQLGGFCRPVVLRYPIPQKAAPPAARRACLIATRGPAGPHIPVCAAEDSETTRLDEQSTSTRRVESYEPPAPATDCQLGQKGATSDQQRSTCTARI
ncbi:unnamed protein product [Amoebophrya sp. A120]|nr:unnamed protein product [Amoebophrya sp. A120]|eukprot:GSA120T00017614001.1